MIDMELKRQFPVDSELKKSDTTLRSVKKNYGKVTVKQMIFVQPKSGMADVLLFSSVFNQSKGSI